MDRTAQALMNYTLLALVALVVCAVLARVVWFFIKSTDKKTVPVAFLLVGFCLELIFIKQPYLQVGLQIYPLDLISAFVFLSVLIAFIYRPLPITEGPFLLWAAFGGTILLSLIVGLDEYGKYAGTEVRRFFYLWVAGLYCCTADFSESDLRRIGRWCVWTAYAVIGIALYFWAGMESGFLNRNEWDFAAVGGVFRPVSSHAAFFVAAVALVQTMAWLRGTGARRAGWHAATFIAFVIIMQHRSVWIAAATGLLCVLYLERRQLPRRFTLLLGFVLVSTLLTAAAAGLGYLDELAASLVRSTVSMADQHGTFAARVDGWDRLVDSWMESSTRIIIFGFPFGHGYTRMYNGELIEFAPHNFYLDLVLRVGIVGALLFLLPTCIAIIYAFRAKYQSEFEYLLTRGLGVGLVASLVYYVAYPTFYIVTAATGVLLAQIILQRRSETVKKRVRIGSLRRPLAGRASR
jgi:hypothetical protein